MCVGGGVASRRLTEEAVDDVECIAGRWGRRL